MTSNTIPKKVTNNYINNKDFFEAIKKYKKEIQKAEKKSLPRPKMPEYIGQCIFKIANNFINNPKFRNAFASFHKEEMIADACFQCVRYLDNFDPEKSSNPFAYFTQFCYNSFIQRLDIEKKHLYIKLKGIYSAESSDMAEQIDSDDKSMDNIDINFEGYEDFINDYEKKHNLGQKKVKRKPRRLPGTVSLFGDK